MTSRPPQEDSIAKGLTEKGNVINTFPRTKEPDEEKATSRKTITVIDERLGLAPPRVKPRNEARSRTYVEDEKPAATPSTELALRSHADARSYSQLRSPSRSADLVGALVSVSVVVYFAIGVVAILLR